MGYKRILLRLTIWILAGLPVLLLSFQFEASGQTNIGGIINTVSSRIDSIFEGDSIVHVNDASGFKVSDTVLIHFTVGASFYEAYHVGGLEGNIKNPVNTGKYAIFILKAVDFGNNLLFLNSTFPSLAIRPWPEGWSAQVVKIPTYKNATVKTALSCNPYNPATGTGGILALFVSENLVLDAKIDVSGKGFPGAVPDVLPFTGTCSTLDPTGYSRPNYQDTQSNFAALKGYSLAVTTNDSTRGRGAVTIGGGGGNGKFSGGGGGANGGYGGPGGFETESCSIGKDIGGKGGISPPGFYINGSNRISLGGGGGTSTQSLPSRKATPGGNGGGIIIIICDGLIAHGSDTINACGQTVPDSATAGAGGGGGGGAIILHVNKYSTTPKVKLYASGGDGGIVANTVEACGPGGGGGSGAIWYNGISLGAITSTTREGHNGTYKTVANGANSGSKIIPVNNLLIPIRGFMFNYIPNPDTICSGNAPKTINAAPPVGGDGIYTYTWLQSPDSLIWAVADSVSTLAAYTPKVATSSTYWYRRFVKDNHGVSDTSVAVKMFVMPALNNPTIYPDTTICEGFNAKTLYSKMNMTGGNGSFRYKWEKSGSLVFSGDSVGYLSTYPTPVLTDTSWYRRVVTSGPLKTQCKVTSNIVKITVLPSIINNTVSQNQEICTGKTPQVVQGSPLLSGGDGSYRYQWQKDAGSEVWNDLPADTLAAYTAVSAIVTPGLHNFRRMVSSGPGKTCKSYSPADTINVMPAIANNILNGITQDTLCYGLPGETLTALGPTGGDGIYTYTWQKNGIDSTGTNQLNFAPGNLFITTTFTRKVTSGSNPVAGQRCLSISNPEKITILPKITNNVISVSKNPNTWCQGKVPDDIAGSLPVNGNGTYTYLWQSSSSPGSWLDRPEITRSFNTPVITGTIDYRRMVTSGLHGTCVDYSDSIRFIMEDSIQNNFINNHQDVFICEDGDSLVLATSFPGMLSGGDEANFTYLWQQSTSLLGPFTDATQPHTSALYQTEPVNSTRYYTRKVTSDQCENTSLAVKVDKLARPELTAFSLAKNEICYNKLDSVISATISYGTLPYVLSFDDGQGLNDFRTFSLNNGKIKPQMGNPALDPGFINYTFEVVSIRDAKNCYAKTVASPVILPLKVWTTPMPERISDLLEETCSANLQLSVSPSFGSSLWLMRNISGIISPDSYVDPVINLSASFTGQDHASASFAYVENIANCPSDTIFVNAILYNNPDSVKNIYKVAGTSETLIGDTIVIFISDNQEFKADPVISGTPSWGIISGAGELSALDGLTTKISKLVQDDPSFLKYSISNGVCPVNSRTIKIVRKELLVYDGFSPNDDHINDELWAVGLADEEVDFKFQVFSSSGNFVREITRKDIKESDLLNNEVVLWDGTTNLGGAGNFVPEGTYYYVLIVKYHGENFNKKGYIIVRR